jgi:leucyl-tRNA synthetase
MKAYDHAYIEKKWQKVWESKKPNKAKDVNFSPSSTASAADAQKKFYALIEFPFASGSGLHTGHIRSNTAMDIVSRKRRREGFNVLYPIGWDSFGLPTENYAIKTGIQPALVTKQNTDNFRKQLKSLGFSFDWSREIDTTDPKYYKWTQWIFLRFLKAGLAYKKKMTINWCPKDLIGLANEEVVDGKCDRCGTPVEKREKEQWMLAITKYAERLYKDLDDVDYLPQIKTQQRNWIGKSEGAEIHFALNFKKNPADNDRWGPNGERAEIHVFTTRPDTLFGVTYIVLSPEHPWVTLATDATHDVLTNKEAVRAYVQSVKMKPEMDRVALGKEKTGIELKGVVAVNPATGEEIPMWIADYVLADYGTGAVMAVPAHDERDFEFAKKYNLQIKEVIVPERIDKRNPPVAGKQSVARKNVHVIIRDPNTKKVLLLKWKQFAWTTFPMGGVEEGEDVVEAARREVLEETGYANLKFTGILGGHVRAEYFAAHKDQNRISFTRAVCFDLVDYSKNEVSEEENQKYDLYWADMREVTVQSMTHAEMDIWLARLGKPEMAYTESGVLMNSGSFDGKESESVKKEMTSFAKGKWVTTFKLRDWVFSRQRYWGEPIPVVHCEKCGTVPLPEKSLPLKLPKVKNYKPTENGESPLAAISSWVNTKCPKCKGKAKRETDTMPNWAGSSWYYLRYIDPKNKKAFADPKKLEYWTPVDWYNGGMEHTTLHLLYSRFWHKFLFDEGLVPTHEPYQKRTAHGLILAEGGVKMSKSLGNVVNPDGIVGTVGADSLRLYEMFMGPFDQAIAWDTNGIVGCRRFIERLWKLADKIGEGKNMDMLVHKTIKKVSEDIEAMHFNTAVSALMIAVNELEKEPIIRAADYFEIVKLLAPFAPHVTEELWQTLAKKKGSIHAEPWTAYDPEKIKETSLRIAIQINGKSRASIEVPPDTSEEEIYKIAINLDEIKKWVYGNDIKKHIYVKGRLLNIVII